MRLSRAAREAAREANQLTDSQYDEQPLGGIGLIIDRGSIFARRQGSYGDPDWKERQKLESIGNGFLARMGYKPHKHAAIGVALTAAIFERENGIESSRSTADWLLEETNEPYGRQTSERAKARQAERKAKGQAFNQCLHEYIQREWPNIDELPKSQPEPQPAKLSEQDLIDHAQVSMAKKISSRVRHSVRDGRGRFTKS